MSRLLSVIIILLAVVYTSFSQEINLERGLVSYYPFDENANDVIGKNHGKNNGASYEEGRCGDMAYNFDGIQDYIDCGNDRSLNGNWSGLSLSVWVRPGNMSELQLATIMAK